ncbi:MAG: IclR family transcriptional regulator [Jatrophihabitans sp.]|nr:MAG: IclR family transcriptional regulator [Jatrophihabitans sp.]
MRQASTAAGGSGIGVIDKTVAILETVARSPCTLADLVAGTGLPRATAHRLAVALETHRILSRDAAGRFQLGTMLADLAVALPDPLISAAGPILTWLRDESGESAQLYRRDGAERVCVASVERTHGLRTTVPVGARLPLTAGSGAQALAAFADDRAALVAAASFSERTLGEVRRRGWAQSVGEREAGVASVSAPVAGSGRPVVAAVSISGPIERLGRTPGQRFGPLLVTGARRLAAALG